MNRQTQPPRSDIETVLNRLQGSAFRRRFRLGEREQTYLATRGRERVLEHARQFIGRRLAPARPRRDGRQTPWRGHPVFVAQHATATCCRSCLNRWHHIPRDRSLRCDEIDYIAELIDRWLQGQALVATSMDPLPLFASRGTEDKGESTASVIRKTQPHLHFGGTATNASG